MIFKSSIRAGLAVTTLVAAACLLSHGVSAEGAAPAAAPAPTFNKGDNAWMLTSTVLVLLMTIPGLALFYGGLVRSKNMLSMLGQVFYTVCIVTILWVIYGYSLTFTGGSAFIGGLDKIFLKGDHHGFAGGDLLGRRHDPRAHLRRLPDDLRGDHARADRGRVRRAHAVLRRGVVHPAVGDLRLFPDRPHGLVLGRPRRDRRGGKGPGCRRRSRGEGRGTDQAR